jgi:hypothetical protein
MILSKAWDLYSQARIMPSQMAQLWIYHEAQKTLFS